MQLQADPLSTKLHKQESTLQAALSHWSSLEEGMFRQKSRESCLHLGDKNSKFFHSVVKVKTTKNHISSLISDNGTPVTKLEELKVMAPNIIENSLAIAIYVQN